MMRKFFLTGFFLLMFSSIVESDVIYIGDKLYPFVCKNMLATNYVVSPDFNDLQIFSEVMVGGERVVIVYQWMGSLYYASFSTQAEDVSNLFSSTRVLGASIYLA
ncbi:MAG: hypothetical protein LR008_01365, partial [Candidatus Pacebacteria bacterium]|nr:hypothetical protein [Candidatus Paceibacterota bacterium]